MRVAGQQWRLGHAPPCRAEEFCLELRALVGPTEVLVSQYSRLHSLQALIRGKISHPLFTALSEACAETPMVDHWSWLAEALSTCPETLSLGFQLKHCEDPVVIDDTDSPRDQEQELLPTEPPSHVVKSQEAPPVALPQGPGLQSRLLGQLSGDPGREPGGVGEEPACPILCLGGGS